MDHWTEAVARTDESQQWLVRFGHSATVVESIPGSEMLVVFGGVSASRADAHEQHTALADVAILHSHSDSWETPLITGTPAPGPRAFHSAAAVGRMLYVFGGHVISFDPDLNKKRRHFFQDMWKLDTDTWQWSLVHGEDSNAPPKRDMSSLVHIGHGNLLLFGGRGEHSRTLGDCWLFDTEKCSWTQVKFSNGPCPPPRKMHAMAVANNRVMLFGGEKDMGVLDDMWALRGLDLSEPFRWTNLRVRPAPSPRFGHSIAVCGSRLVVFGGCLELSGFLYINRNYLQCRELWVLDIPTFGWVKVEEDGSTPVPSERMCHTVSAFSDGRVLVMGGRGRERISADSWWLDLEAALAPSTAQAEAAAKACTSQNNAQASLLSTFLNPLKVASMLVTQPAEPSQASSSAVSTTTEGTQGPQDAGGWLRVAGGVSSNAIGRISSAVSLGSLQSAMNSVLGDTAAGALNTTLGAMHPAALARQTGMGYSPNGKETALGWKHPKLENAGLVSALAHLRTTKFRLPAVPPPFPAQQPLAPITATPDPIPALIRLAHDLRSSQEGQQPKSHLSHHPLAKPQAPAFQPDDAVPAASMTSSPVPEAISSLLEPVQPQDVATPGAAVAASPNVLASALLASHALASDSLAYGVLSTGALPHSVLNTAGLGNACSASTSSQLLHLPSQSIAQSVWLDNPSSSAVMDPLLGHNAVVSSSSHETQGPAQTPTSPHMNDPLIESAQKFLCSCPMPELTMSQLTVLLGDYKRLALATCRKAVQQHLQTCAAADSGFVQMPAAVSHKFAHLLVTQIRVADLAALQHEYMQLVQQARSTYLS